MNNDIPVSLSPDLITALETAFGPRSDAAFGSAVFHQPLPEGGLEAGALDVYRAFTGSLWERFGEDAWLAPWAAVYTRPSGASPAIIAELRAISDRDVSRDVENLLDNRDDAGAAQATLAAVYNDPAMQDVVVYRLGDDAAMSGLEIAGRTADDKLVAVVFLLD